MNKEEQEVRKKSPVQIRNKKASFEYYFIDTFTAGIVLTGTEIKSIRAVRPPWSILIVLSTMANYGFPV